MGVFSRKWWAAAGVRALKTWAQAALATIGSGAVGMLQVDWVGVLSVATVAAVTSLLTSLAGLPELRQDEGTMVDENGEVL